MTSNKGKILVIGATGRQGNGAIRHLLTTGWQVIALTRDSQASKAQILRHAGVEVVQGDTNNLTSLEQAMQGVYGVFFVLPFSENEAYWGKNVATAAKKSGVQHFVYSSGQSAEQLFNIGSNVAKWEIEQYIHALDLPATVLRPAGFMEDLIGPFFDASRNTFSIAIQPDVAMQLIAVNDIGAFTAHIFEYPDKYLGKTIELAADELTPPQIAEAISRVVGHSVSFIHISIEAIRQHSEEIARVYELFNNGGYQINIAAVRQLYPDLMSFETWLEQEGAAKLKISQP